MKGIGIKELENQKFKEELSWFILEEEVRVDELKDLLKQWNTGLITGKGLRSKLSLFSRSSRGRAQTLNHLVGMTVRVTRQEGKEVNLYP
jgi:hypothetical protein